MARQEDTPQFRRHWRLYKTAAGGDVVSKELDDLGDENAACLFAEMKAIALHGLRVGGARNLRGDIWEVRAEGDQVALRALFAKQGRFGQVLLALHVFSKKTQQTPQRKIDLAEKRLADWIAQGTGRV